MKDKTWIIIPALVIFTLIGFVGLSKVSRMSYDQDNSFPDSKPIPENITIRGTITCLPHKGDGPHNLECALGLRSGRDHYGLDLSELPNRGIGLFDSGDQVEVTGIFTPFDEIEERRMQTYDIEGVIIVEEVNGQ